MERNLRGFNLFLLALLACTVATWALGLANIKYKTVANVGFTEDFPGDPALWQPAGDWSNININDEEITVFRQSDKRSYAKRRFELPAPSARATDKLQVHGVVRTNEVVGNPDDNSGASFMVWLEDTSGEIAQYMTVFSLPGERALYEGERIAQIGDNISAFILVMNSRDSADSFSLVNASAEIVDFNPNYLAALAIVAMLWFVLSAIIVQWLLRHAPLKTTLLTGALLIGIFIGITIPETPTIPIIDPIFQAIARALNHSSAESGIFIYKTGHFLFFFFTGLVLMLKAGVLPANRVQLASVLILLAIATEGMQLHLNNRTTQFFDIGVDTFGIMLALAVSQILLMRQQKPASRPKRSHRKKRTHR